MNLGHSTTSSCRWRSTPAAAAELCSVMVASFFRCCLEAVRLPRRFSLFRDYDRGTDRPLREGALLGGEPPQGGRVRHPADGAAQPTKRRGRGVGAGGGRVLQ